MGTTVKIGLNSNLKQILKRRCLRASLAERTALQIFYSARSHLYRFPVSASESNLPAIYNDWWYYGVELIPGLITKGIFPREMPFLPRILMRNCDLSGMDCLDLGTMEGLMATLMGRQGARTVTATDAWFHCHKKMCAVKHYYDAHFAFRYVGTLYELSKRLSLVGRKSFDFIHLSGILYHVFSPMHVLAGIRPLLKKDGLMIISTNVIERSDFSMEFNNAGRLQTEVNTFWYLSVPLLDYMLRYFRLRPIDCIYHPYREDDTVRYTQDINTGYISVVCRATDNIPADSDDTWISSSIESSWENIALCDKLMLSKQTSSRITYRKPLKDGSSKSDDVSIDLQRATKDQEPVLSARQRADSHILHLEDQF